VSYDSATNVGKLTVLFAPAVSNWIFVSAAAQAEGQTPALEYMKLSPEVFERTIDYMVTLNLALFGLVGYSLTKLSNITAACLKRVAVLCAAVFLLFGVSSLVFGYLSRIWLVSRLAIGLFDYEKSNDYVYQADALLVAGVFALLFSFIALSARERAAIISTPGGEP
jgi:hypothetical protein